MNLQSRCTVVTLSGTSMLVTAMTVWICFEILVSDKMAHVWYLTACQLQFVLVELDAF